MSESRGRVGAPRGQLSVADVADSKCSRIAVASRLYLPSCYTHSLLLHNTRCARRIVSTLDHRYGKHPLCVSACQVVCPLCQPFVAQSSPDSLSRARLGDEHCVEMLGGPLVPVPSTEGEGGDTAAADAGAVAVEVADDDVVLAPSGKDSPRSRPWTEEEDHTVRSLVLSYGTRRWSLIAAQLHRRTGKQCRERWHKGNTSLRSLFPFFPPLRAMAPTPDCAAAAAAMPRLSLNHTGEATTPVRSASETRMLFAAAWQHEAAAAIQRQMRGYRATSAKGRPTTGWRSNQEAEMRNARLLHDNRDLKATNAELETKLQTELQRALAHAGLAPSCGATNRLSWPLAARRTCCPRLLWSSAPEHANVCQCSRWQRLLR